MSFDWTSAVSLRAVVQFEYEGEACVVEPYVYGLNQTANYALLGFQVNGGEQGEASRGWRLFVTSRAFGPRTTGAFSSGVRAGYNPDTREFIEIRYRVR